LIICFLRQVPLGGRKKGKSIALIPWANYLYRHQTKMLSSKIIDLLRDFATAVIGIYKLEIQLVMLVVSTQLCELFPLPTFSLVQLFALPPFLV